MNYKSKEIQPIEKLNAKNYTSTNRVIDNFIRFYAESTDKTAQLSNIQHQTGSEKHFQWNEALEKPKERAKILHEIYRSGSRNIERAKKETLSDNLVDTHNVLVDNFNKNLKELVALNDKIEKYNATRPEGTPKIEKLDLPKKKLRHLNTKADSRPSESSSSLSSFVSENSSWLSSLASESFSSLSSFTQGLELFTTGSKESNERSQKPDAGVPGKEYVAKGDLLTESHDDKSPENSSWLSSETVMEAAKTFIREVNKLNPKTAMKLMGLSTAFLMLASQRAEAATIYGKNCSLDSTLHIQNNNASLNILAGRLETQFEKVFPTLVERFAKDPCDPGRSDIWLSLASLRESNPGAAGTVYGLNGNNITIDPDGIGGPNPTNGVPEGVMTHELTHVAQNYTDLSAFWVREGIAEYARRLYGPMNDLPLPEDLELGDHYTEGYGAAAGFLSWLEQHVKLKEGSPLDTTAKLNNGTIVDAFNRYVQVGSFNLEIDSNFQASTDYQSLNEAWKAYFRSRFEIPTKTQTVTQTETQVIKQTDSHLRNQEKVLYSAVGAVTWTGIAVGAMLLYKLYRKSCRNIEQGRQQDQNA